jgi:signal transduction histidine kinase/ActR/RegA family two-component response regulator
LRILNERTGAVSQTAVQRILESGSAVGLGSRLTLVAADGSNQAVEMSASPIRDRMNRKIGIVMLLRDVTEKERLEDDRSRAEKLESLGVAAGGIAHDFNNLLTAILGNLALAMMEVDEETSLSTRLSTAKRACHRAQDLAQQLLTFAKGGAPVKKTASVRQLIEDTVRYALRDSRARCEFDIDPSLWSCEIDSGQIGQVVANLATNADQAMPGGGAIRIRCENYFVSDDDEDGGPALPLRAGRYVRISVEDEGIGIPSEYIAKIFDPYFTTKPKGSGLGLATAYSIVKNHDGHIGVESRTGSGTTFHVYLPASDREQPPSAAAAAPGRVPDASAATGRTGKRVLVMEDEEVICMLVEATLAPEGYEVLSAADGREGIKLYKEALAEGKPFDLIITDLTMPGGMGGLDAIKRLREIDPAVVAIVSSGYANDPVMSRYREYGFCGGIAKPYEVGELLNLVRSLTAPAADPIEATGD